jgi:hypothetical protein
VAIRNPKHPGDLVCTNQVAKFNHKEALQRCHTARAVDAAGVRLILHIFDRQYFVDLEDADGEILGHGTKTLLNHLESTFTST